MGATTGAVVRLAGRLTVITGGSGRTKPRQWIATHWLRDRIPTSRAPMDASRLSASAPSDRSLPTLCIASGVGELLLIDPDSVLPGNVVRHLVGEQHVGKPKVDAVKQVLHTARPGATTSVVAQKERTSTLDRACELLATCDLVVDASADSTASR
ncbi:MAG: ThiF family adenylyltransferase [Dermatophilaceae bacterium]